jgi:protein gp37
MGVAGRFSGPGLPYAGLTTKTTQGYKWTGKIILVDDALCQPIYWKRPRKIFVNSMSDLFHEGAPEWYIDRVFVTMAVAKQHSYQILTKRPERMRDYIKAFSWERAVANCVGEDGVSVIHKYTMQALRGHFGIAGELNLFKLLNMWPLPNVWLGVSVENQETADQRIPVLLQTPAAIRWLSMEPLLGPVDLGRWLQSCCGNFDSGAWYMGDREQVCCGNPEPLDAIHWVVVGGESGAGARPMHPDWARSLRGQCAAAGVPFLFKQWGEWCPRGPASLGYPSVEGVPRFRMTDTGDDGQDMGSTGGEDVWMNRAGKKATGRLLDGVLHDGYPEVAA